MFFTSISNCMHQRAAPSICSAQVANISPMPSFQSTSMGGDSMCLFLLLFLLFPSALICDSCVHQARAGFFSSFSALSDGFCGYGPMALGFNGGYLAAASPALHKGSTVSCGACFQVICKDKKICNDQGVKVILTDLNERKDADLVLSRPAFVALARQGMAKELKKVSIVDVEYKRIACEYSSKNLSIRVEEKSQRPNFLAIKFLYQGGQTDIMAVDVAQVGSSSWQFMSRDDGPVWRTDRAPAGPLHLRMVVTGGYGGKWVWAREEVLPADWKTGSVYDLGVQISDIAYQGCTIREL